MPIHRTCIDCGQLIPRTHSRCTQHQADIDTQRGDTTQRGYGTDWQQFRITILKRDNYQCQIRSPICTHKATTVDHINPLARGGPRLDPANTQAACRACNSSKGARPTRRQPSPANSNRPDEDFIFA